MDELQPERTERRGPGYERRDIAVKPLLIFAVALIVLAVPVFFGMAWLLKSFDTREAARATAVSPIAAERQIPPEPRLELNERESFVQLRQKEEQLLNNYAWVNRTTDTVRIPVSRAMELIAERGLPARTPAPEKK